MSLGKIEDGTSFVLPATPQRLRVRCHPLVDLLERLDEQWVTRSLPFPDDASRAEFLAWRSPVWVGMAFPAAPMDRLLDICLVTSLLFALDDACYDVYAGQDPASAHHDFSLMLACLAGRVVPITVPLVAAFEEIWHGMRTRISDRQQKRFYDAAEVFFEGCIEEIVGRSRGEILTFDAYKTLRDKSLGGHLYLLLTEYAAEVDLEEELRDYGDLRELNRLASDHWLFTNDLFSFRREYYSGDFMNAVLVLVHRHTASLQDAVNSVGTLLSSAEDGFVRCRDRILVGPLGERPEILRYLASIRGRSEGVIVESDHVDFGLLRV